MRSFQTASIGGRFFLLRRICWEIP